MPLYDLGDDVDDNIPQNLLRPLDNLKNVAPGNTKTGAS